MLNTCTVSVALLTAKSVELLLKLSEKIRAGYVPRRNWYNFVVLGMEKTRTIVPLSLAVANSVPSKLNASAESRAFMRLDDIDGGQGNSVKDDDIAVA